MNRYFYFSYLIIFILPLVFTSCSDQPKSESTKTSHSSDNDTLINFTIELIKKLDNNIVWTRTEFDSTTSKNIVIHRPIYCVTDKYTETESIEGFDLFKYFTKNELNHSSCDSLDFKIIKRYNTVKNDIVEINSSTIENWYKESDRILQKNPKAEIPASFQWYFSVSKPTLTKNGKYIYMELFESNFDRESMWTYILKKENDTWKLLKVDESIVEM